MLPRLAWEPLPRPPAVSTLGLRGLLSALSPELSSSHPAAGDLQGHPIQPLTGQIHKTQPKAKTLPFWFCADRKTTTSGGPTPGAGPGRLGVEIPVSFVTWMALNSFPQRQESSVQPVWHHPELVSTVLLGTQNRAAHRTVS